MDWLQVHVTELSICCHNAKLHTCASEQGMHEGLAAHGLRPLSVDPSHACVCVPAESNAQGAWDYLNLPADLYPEEVPRLPADLYPQATATLPKGLGTQKGSGFTEHPHATSLTHASASLQNGVHGMVAKCPMGYARFFMCPLYCSSREQPTEGTPAHSWC